MRGRGEVIVRKLQVVPRNADSLPNATGKWCLTEHADLVLVCSRNLGEAAYNYGRMMGMCWIVSRRRDMFREYVSEFGNNRSSLCLGR